MLSIWPHSQSTVLWKNFLRVGWPPIWNIDNFYNHKRKFLFLDLVRILWNSIDPFSIEFLCNLHKICPDLYQQWFNTQFSNLKYFHRWNFGQSHLVCGYHMWSWNNYSATKENCDRRNPEWFVQRFFGPSVLSNIWITEHTKTHGKNCNQKWIWQVNLRLFSWNIYE